MLVYRITNSLQPQTSNPTPFPREFRITIYKNVQKKSGNVFPLLNYYLFQLVKVYI